MTRWIAAILVATCGLGGISTAWAEPRPIMAFEGGCSFAEPTLVVGMEVGVRVDDQWTLLVEADWNPWLSIEGPELAHPGVLNLGIGVEHVWADGLLRSAFFTGTSTLLFESALDQRGTTGIFIDLLPVGIRVPLERDVVTLRIDPISAHIIAPSLGALPLVRYEFRHTLSIEVTP